MKTQSAPALFLIALFFVSCDGDWNGGDYKYIDYDIHGTWERTEAAFWPEGQAVATANGQLLIGFDTLTVSGPVAHLQGYTRGTALEAYTEDGKLYIKDKGAWQSPLAYTRWDSADPYPENKRLTLTGGGVADETVKLIGDEEPL